MRAAKTEAVGTSGQSFVKAQFEALGWGAAPNPEHDLGTDLWLMARDLLRYDLGALVGAQIKSGPSYFEEPEFVDGNVSGWWYREKDDSHFSYWCDHNVPHILVLHRNEDNVSFWVHVTADKVISTGTGRKIFVPASSTVDREHFDALVAVAASKPNVQQWEGSVWHIGRGVRDDSRLRYALVTPRLIAPHPNAKAEELDAYQAIALLVQMRVSELGRYADRQPRLDPTSVQETDTVAWRLYSALHRWLMKGEFEPLSELTDAVDSSDERSAIAVCVAHVLLEGGRAGESRDVVQSALAFEDVNPVDRGWLEAHRARCLFELGKLEDARRCALDVQGLRHIAPRDPTARTLIGSAAQTIFSLGEWSSESVADVVQSRDNLASWWRSQTLVTALGEQFAEAFKAWAHDTAVTFRAEDVVWTRLRSTMLLAGYAADSSAWRYGATLLAQRELMTADDGDSLVWALNLLRFAGADNDIKLAVRRLLEFGPVEPLLNVSESIDLSQSTRTSLKADLTLLERAGDVLPKATCDRHIMWALATLEKGEGFLEGLRASFRVAASIVDVISSLVPNASAAVRQRVMEHVLSLPAVEDPLLASSYGQLIRALGAEPWGAERLAALVSRVAGDGFEFVWAVEHIRAKSDDGFRSRLVDRIATGDLAALESYGDVSNLPPDAAAGMIKFLATRVTERTTSARRGEYAIGGHDVLRALLLMNTWHPEQASWEPLIEALAESKSAAEHITGAMALLGEVTDRLPADVCERLEGPLQRIANGKMDPHDSFRLRNANARAEAIYALARMFPASINDAELCKLVRGEPAQRAVAVQIISSREDAAHLSLFAALSKDPDMKVRAAVAYGLATWVARGVGTPGSTELLAEFLREPGVKLGLYVSSALGGRLHDEGVLALIDQLKAYPSSRVRTRVASIRSGFAAG